MFEKFLSRMARNTYENKIATLKAEIYDLNQKIERLQTKDKREKEIITKIKNLPADKKKELDIL